MPVYVHYCERCNVEVEDTRPMSESDRHPNCPECGAVMPKNLGAQNIAVAAFRPYAACSGGALPQEMARAHQDENGNWILPVRREDGSVVLRQLNMPGEVLHPKSGDVMISSSGERKRYMASRGYIDLNDFDSESEENRRRRAASGIDAKIERARKRYERGKQAAESRGRKVGWIEA